MTSLLREKGTVIETSPLLLAAILAMLGLLVVHVNIALPELGAANTLVDFDAFYLVGLLIGEGRLEEAYHFGSMRAVQHAFNGSDSFMPWTYPPQFNLIAALLPMAGRAVAYSIFIAVTLAAYVLVLRRIAGHHLTFVLLALLPVLMVTALIGQNGFLTGALVGAFCLMLLSGRASAGLALGLMVIKPHLGVALGVLVLARGDWRVLAVAAATVVFSSGLATLVFGVSIWAAFLGGVHEAGGFLQAGYYPMFRMTSLYAALHTLGIAPQHALLAQATVAAAALTAVIWTARRWQLRHALAVACFASVAISPYTYDYDMTIFGVGLALIAREIVTRCSAAQKGMLVCLCWLGGAWGMLGTYTLPMQTDPNYAEVLQSTLSMSGPIYLLLLALGAFCLARPAARLGGRSAA
ncbi:glycosyltransferase family 87 protein [Pararhodobacter sp. SW119]|uniref:glycosyltransferase family 87 protein n=1 Tax=Pararhodobacter sp. SW119 TaxID=2780075 RepID=UPI001AE0A148|nr:glycosyltransferase family 87 protein [Pararhodobacter sp. SW119]